MPISNQSAIQNAANAFTGDDETTGDTVTLVLNELTLSNEANTTGLPVVVSPAVPATTVVQKNTKPYAVQVTVTGGTVTVIQVNGTTTGATAGTFVVPSGGTIAITYSVAPTWVWTYASGPIGFVSAYVAGVLVKVPYFAV